MIDLRRQLVPLPDVPRECLEAYNRRVGAMLENWYRHSGAVWTPGMIVPPEVRWRLDTFVPWNEVRIALAALAKRALPSPEWLPRMLWHGALESVIEWWEELPQYAGRLVLAESEMMPCLCACADPPRYGTTLGRYPGQLEALKTMVSPGCTLLDIGCGVGLGTLEAADALQARQCLGVTLEPLEAWMANARCLPHAPERTRMFHALAVECAAAFVPGDAVSFQYGQRFDVVLCNGLAGGRFLQQEAAMEAFLKNTLRHMAPGAVLAMANSFHPGQQGAVLRLANLARMAGMTPVNLHWRNLIFRKRGGT